MTKGTKAVRCYSVQRGDFWRGQCPDCNWNSGTLPFETRKQAEHCVDLHAVLCKGPASGAPLPSEPVEPTSEDRHKARLLAEGGGFNADVQDLFAEGIAVARSGGDVEGFLREQLRKKS